MKFSGVNEVSSVCQTVRSGPSSFLVDLIILQDWTLSDKARKTGNMFSPCF